MTETETRLTETENRLTVAKREEGGVGWIGGLSPLEAFRL